MAELGYVYDLGAARMRAARSRTVGVIIPNLTNPFFAVMLAGIESTLEAQDLAVILANSNENVTKQDGFIRRMREHGVDGLIICPAEGTDAALARNAAAWGMPLVQVLRVVPGTLSDHAGIDYRGGIHDATSRLIALGHRRILFASGKRRHSAAADRLDGFATAMRQSGLDANLVLRLELTHKAGRAAAAEILDLPDRPTAVICFNDVLGLGLHRGLYDLGIQLGHDLSLVGFDDVAEADLVRPSLASVATRPFKVGQSAAQLMARRMASPDAPVKTVVEATCFVARDSFGPAPNRG